MTEINSPLGLVLALLISIAIVAGVISIGWYLIWKLILSKFRLARELFGLPNADEAPNTDTEPLATSVNGSLQTHNKLKKIRKD